MGNERAELGAEPEAADPEEHDEQRLGRLAREQARAQGDVGARQQQAPAGRRWRA
jgi:hypothetical protein